MKFKSGPLATVKVGWFSKGFLQSIHVCGAAKNMSARISPLSTMEIIRMDIKRKLGMNPADPNYTELEYFMNCLLNNEEPSPSGEESLKSMEVISKAYENSSKISCKT